MKRNEISSLIVVGGLVLLWFLLAVSRVYGQLPAGLIVEPQQPYVAIIEAKPRPLVVDVENATPQSRAEALRWVCTQVTPGQSIKLAEEVYDFGLTAFRPPGGNPIIGRGKGKTRIRSCQEDQRHSCGVEIAYRGVSLSAMTVEWYSRDGQTRGGQALGIADPNNQGNTQATFKDLEVISYGSCALYYWGGGKNHAGIFTGCEFHAGRWAGCIGAGSGDDSALLKFSDCTFHADFGTFGGAGGDMGTPSNTAAFVSRGGQATLTDCTFNVTGYPGTGKPNDPNGPPFEYALGVVTGSLGDPALPKWSYKWPYLTLVRPVFNVNANGAKKAIDAWCQSGTLVVDGKQVAVSP